MATAVPKTQDTQYYPPPQEIYDVVLNPNTSTQPLDDENGDFAKNFKRMQHFSYLLGLDSQHMQEQLYFHVTDYLKMSAVYWSIMALYLAGGKHLINEKDIIDFVMQCYDKDNTGGFRGNINHDVHLLYTLSAVQILAIFGKLDLLDRPKLYDYLQSLQRTDGSFVGDVWGEVDTRFSYCAMLILAILNEVPPIDVVLQYDQLEQQQATNTSIEILATKTSLIKQYPLLAQINFAKAIEYVLMTRNFDGGFGAVCGGESHSGQIFCALAFLCLLNVMQYDPQIDSNNNNNNNNSDLHSTSPLSKPSNTNMHKQFQPTATDIDPQSNTLGWWLCERQLANGGLNGRPEKKEDVCYSWWVLTSLTMLKKIKWINKDKLTTFILSCQDNIYGGISDRSDTMTDVYHTYFGIAGLSLLNQPTLERIDPVYALPLHTVLTVKGMGRR